MAEYHKGLKLTYQRLRRLHASMLETDMVYPIPIRKFNAFSKAFRHIGDAKTIIENLLKKENK